MRTRARVKPLFVSPGHRIGVRAAVHWVLSCSRFRVPEPIRQAEQLVNGLRRAGSGAPRGVAAPQDVRGRTFAT